jgi:hypothetical protein
VDALYRASESTEYESVQEVTTEVSNGIVSSLDSSDKKIQMIATEGRPAMQFSMPQALHESALHLSVTWIKETVASLEITRDTPSEVVVATQDTSRGRQKNPRASSNREIN